MLSNSWSNGSQSNAQYLELDVYRFSLQLVGIPEMSALLDSIHLFVHNKLTLPVLRVQVVFI